MDDGFGILKGLYHVIPGAIEGYKTAYKFATNKRDLAALVENPSLAWEGTKDAAGLFRDAVTEPYRKHGLKAPLMQPFTTLGDVLFVNGALSKSIGKAAQMAGGKVMAAPVRKVDQLATFAAKMDAMPSQLVRKGIDVGVKKVTGIDLPKRREFLAIQREEVTAAALRAKDDWERVGKIVAQLDDTEAAMLHKARVFGDAPQFGIPDQALAANPKVKAALEAWEALINKDYAPTLKARNLLHSDSTVKKFAAEAFGSVDDAALAQAKALMAQAKRQPVYGPSLFDKKAMSVDDYVDEMLGLRKGKASAVPFLEEYKGKAGSITDPRVYMPKHIQVFRRVEGELRFRDRLLQSTELTGAPKAAQVLQQKPPPGDIPKKYYQDQLRWEQAREKITDPTIKRLLELRYARAQGPLRTILRTYDSILGFFRKSATAGRLFGIPFINPRYVTGNAVGDAVLGTLAGADWAKAKALIQKRAMPSDVLAKGSAEHVTGVGGFFEKAMDIPNAFDRRTGGGIVTREVAHRLETTAHRFMSSSDPLETVMRSTADFADVQVEMQRLFEQVARNSDTVRRLDAAIAGSVKQGNLQRASSLQTRRDVLVRDIADDMVKSGHLEAKLPKLKEQVAIVRHGVDRSNAFTGDYNGLDGFEQSVMRRLIPFYPWTKAMSMLTFRLPFLSPVKSFLWHRYSKAMMSMVGDPELPEYMKGRVPVFSRANGDTVWVNLNSYSPFAGLRRTSAANIPIPNIMSPEQNPFISLGVHFMGGKTIFDRSSIPYGEQMVHIGNGDVYEFTQGGKLRKVIPQTPLISGIVHMFPITQFLQDAVLPYQVSKYNVYGWPEPALNTDGSYKYPREYWQRLASAAGINVQSRSRENIIAMEKVRVRQALIAMRASYRKANPEEREAILQAMRDYANGEYRRFE